MEDIIKLKKVVSYPDEIPFLVKGDRKYQIPTFVRTELFTDCGLIITETQPGYLTDGRSGGFWVDWLLPNVGNKYYRRMHFFHDNFFGFAAECEANSIIPPVSFDTANHLFGQGLLLPKAKGGPNLADWKAKLAWRGVHTWIAESGYYKADGFDVKNFGKCKVFWEPK